MKSNKKAVKQALETLLRFRMEIDQSVQERIKALGLTPSVYFLSLAQKDLKEGEEEKQMEGMELVWESRGMRCKLTRSVDGKGTLFFESGREHTPK